MKDQKKRSLFIPLFYPLFLVSWALAIVLYFICPALFWVPLAALILVCFGAPFFPAVSFYLPIISKFNSMTKSVVLTIDDGPEPAVTVPLLELMEEFNIKATFFVIGEKAEKNPEIIQQILENGHNIGNHSYSHSMTLMLKPSKKIEEEIKKTEHLLSSMGIRPLLFRPPAGVTNPKVGSVLKGLGLQCVNFSCRGNDFGNRKIEDLSGRLLRSVKGGDIVLIHDCLPLTEGNIPRLLNEFRLFFNGLEKMGITIVPIDDCLGRPAMETVK